MRCCFVFFLIIRSPPRSTRTATLIPDTMLFRSTGDPRIESLRLAEVYRARVVDATISSFIFEVTGTTDKIDAFASLMREVGLVEIARTGVAAISRGREQIGRASCRERVCKYV